MEFQDKHLTCIDCGTEFIWTAGEQTSSLTRTSRTSRSAARRARPSVPVARPGAGMRERVETATNCSACGKETTVPFRPTQGRPVFCKECFQQRKFVGAEGV